MARPKMSDDQKNTEWVVVRLSKTDHKLFSEFARSIKSTLSGYVYTLIQSTGAFEHDISDEIYADILQIPEASYFVQRMRSKDDVSLIRSYLTKEEKKSLTYHAVMKCKTSVTIFVHGLVQESIKDIIRFQPRDK